MREGHWKRGLRAVGSTDGRSCEAWMPDARTTLEPTNRRYTTENPATARSTPDPIPPATTVARSWAMRSEPACKPLVRVMRLRTVEWGLLRSDEMGLPDGILDGFHVETGTLQDVTDTVRIPTRSQFRMDLAEDGP